MFHLYKKDKAEQEVRKGNQQLILDSVKPKPRTRKVLSWKHLGNFPWKELYEKQVAKHGKDSKHAQMCLTDRVADVMRRLRTIKTASQELTEAQAEGQLTEKETKVLCIDFEMAVLKHRYSFPFHRCVAGVCSRKGACRSRVEGGRGHRRRIEK